MQTQVIIVMGVSGSGKSTLGAAIAAALGWKFFDADAFHTPANREKMARGLPLTDADRAPWLARLSQLLAEQVQHGQKCVLACSALRQSYRDALQAHLPAGSAQVVFATGPADLIAQRLQQRQQAGTHFMPASLLESQLQTLELPTDAVQADIRRPVPELVAEVLRQLR